MQVCCWVNLLTGDIKLLVHHIDGTTRWQVLVDLDIYLEMLHLYTNIYTNIYKQTQTDSKLVGARETGLSSHFTFIFRFLILNVDKTKTVVFGTRSTKNKFCDHKIKIGDHPLDEVDNYKYLGLTLDPPLNRTPHSTNVHVPKDPSLFNNARIRPCLEDNYPTTPTMPPTPQSWIKYKQPKISASKQHFSSRHTPHSLKYINLLTLVLPTHTMSKPPQLAPVLA